MGTGWNRFGRLVVYVGVGSGILCSYVARHPWVAVFAVTMGISGFIGWLITDLALLVHPMKRVWFLDFLLMGPAAVFSAQRDSLLSRRLWVAMLTSVMGLLAMRVIYHDLLHLELDPGFRSSLIGIFGLVCGVSGFIKVR